MNRFQRLLRWGSVSSVAMLGLMLVLFSSRCFTAWERPYTFPNVCGVTSQEAAEKTLTDARFRVERNSTTHDRGPLLRGDARRLAAWAVGR
jgi:hypothetical protein